MSRKKLRTDRSTLKDAAALAGDAVFHTPGLAAVDLIGWARQSRTWSFGSGIESAPIGVFETKYKLHEISPADGGDVIRVTKVKVTRLAVTDKLDSVDAVDIPLTEIEVPRRWRREHDGCVSTIMYEGTMATLMRGLTTAAGPFLAAAYDRALDAYRTLEAAKARDSIASKAAESRFLTFTREDVVDYAAAQIGVSVGRVVATVRADTDLDSVEEVTRIGARALQKTRLRVTKTDPGTYVIEWADMI